MQQTHGERIKLGIVANEFFAETVGRFGGFGWAARQVAVFFAERPELGVDVVYLARQSIANASDEPMLVHGTKLIPVMSSARQYWKAIRDEKIDVLLSIDYRANYAPIFYRLSKTPIIVWSRDPRTREDSSRLRSVRIPGKEDFVPPSVHSASKLSMRNIMRFSKYVSKRPVLFATPTRYLGHKVIDTYDVMPKTVAVLPNPLDIDPGDIRKTEKPSVVFLGRIDPVKRPWLFSELARDFPDTDFIFCGKVHVEGEGGWQPENLPPNVRFAGHVDGDEKLRLLAGAWVLINTSIHEGLAVSFQEALRCKTPVLSSVDPQGVVTRFGIYTGDWEGTGLASLPMFRAGLRKLLEDDAFRERLGREGNEWVQRNHTLERFYNSFRELLVAANVRGADQLVSLPDSSPTERD